MVNSVLPENWGEVCLVNRGYVLDYSLMFGEKMGEHCIHCPMSRLVAKGRRIDYYQCRAINNCIRAYPHICDKKEFL